MERSYSQACENNKAPILAVLQQCLQEQTKVLEIASGTGQHAVYFAEQLPEIVWQPSDLAEHLPGILQWINSSPAKNILPPIKLNVADRHWPIDQFNTVFTANSLHIMSWQLVEVLFNRLADYLPSKGLFICYGPFNINGKYTSESNARFDQWLKLQDPNSGIRDLDSLTVLAKESKLQLDQTIAMPANNKILIWRKQT